LFCRRDGDHRQESLAKSGYKPDMPNTKIFNHPSIFWAMHFKTKYRNLAIIIKIFLSLFSGD
jgi:hypothetical protein